MTVCDDASYVIDNWDPEVLTIQRNSLSFDSTGMSVNNYVNASSFVGDWQPANGNTAIVEEGRKVRSEAFVIAPCGLDVIGEDRVQKVDGSFMYVNHVKVYRGHITIFLKKTEGSN